ncbi:hypothetical protein [Sphingobacterium paucimobilis]|uniref:hypothetical protein n=1 Tax=Sphingobacterium paucimobilis TaxID=1385985 RepID=UPI0003B58663|nr:hypothetical protein [Sphingobacterium paucimobilis]
MKHINTYIAFVFLSLFCGSCGSGGCNVVPNVTFQVTLSQGSSPDLYRPGGWAYADGGVCGLIVYNDGGNVIAYDRCSTVNIQQRNRVEVNGFEVVDSASGAKWLLLDGSPAHIAECHLKPYRVSKSGDFYKIYN